MAKKEKKTNFTLTERLTLLEEAENFFKEVGTLSDNDMTLYKAMALGTVREWLLLVNSKWVDLEKNLEDALNIVINEDIINHFIEEHNIEWENKDFYLGWFGMAVWIMSNNEETYDGLRELQDEWYEKVLPNLQKSLENE